MEITLTLDDELLARVRALAVQRQATLDDLLSEQLRKLCEMDEQTEAWVRRTRETAGHAGRGYRFRRADAYEHLGLE